MKNSSNFKVLFIVSGLLVFLSITTSLLNYAISLSSLKTNLITRSLPLSVNNIYTEIQTHVVEPSLISSMMASDTFVKDWLLSQDADEKKITRYLESIKNRYGLFSTFLVSEKTQKYYTYNGFLEVLDKNKTDNQWYYRFKSTETEREINLDHNDNIDNSLMMFINYKIYDKQYHLLGITGIVHKISYINNMLKRFNDEYNFKACFVDVDGKIVLAQNQLKKLNSIKNDKEWNKIFDQILYPDAKVFEYKRDSKEYLLQTKYIPELHLYLLVEVKIDDFTQKVDQAFYINILVSLFVTLVIAFIILFTIKKYNKKLAFLARHDPLTQLYNRRIFEEKIEHYHELTKRNKESICLLFLDLDNFKGINDKYGHHIGDKVLTRLAEILKMQLRKTDFIARWGGEEFIVGLINTEIENAQEIAEKLRAMIESDLLMKKYVVTGVTASFGVTQYKTAESLEHAVARVDNAMYEAKKSGKNRVFVS